MFRIHRPVAEFCDILQHSLLSHTQSIGDQHPTGKQGFELSCSPCGSSCTDVVLNIISAFPERFNPTYHCAIWERCIATFFTQSLKHSCVLRHRATSNLNQERCPSAVCMLRRHIVLLIAIHPSGGYFKPGGTLSVFREEKAMSRHRVSPSPFLSSSWSHTPQHNHTTKTVTLNSTYSSTLYRCSSHT